MFSKFFIDRPIFATVLALLIVVAGLVTLGILPIAQYPDITPPTVQVSAVYPGANAQTVAQTVGIPIEQQVNGVDGMLYMSSNSSSSGAYSLTITFAVGTDIDMATVQVQNRVSVAQSSLPTPVVVQGVTVQKQSSNIVMFLTMTSDSKDYDGLYLSNYAKLNLVDQLTRVPGVGAVNVMGAGDYSMRIWLDPAAMRIRYLSPADVYQAIQSQNVEVSAGNVGQPIGTDNKNAYQYSLTVKGRLTSPEEFGNIILRTETGGKILRLRDVAHIDLGSASYSVVSQLDGKPTAAIAIYQQPGSNSLDVSKGVKAKIQELSQNFPAGIQYNVTLDTTDVIHASIDEVMVTFLETTLLVVLVIFLFLQNWRAVVIPCITIPVSLIGTLAVMSLFGFSINTLTLFGLILAVAIVVDDAIVVVENVEHLMETEKLSPYEATKKAMNGLASALIATSLVLCAVFVPVSFLSGITGQLYRQFTITIAVSVLLSTVVALTLSPVMCSLILKPDSGKKKNIVFRKINEWLNLGNHKYVAVINRVIRNPRRLMSAFGLVLVAIFIIHRLVPTSFLPVEDQGYFKIELELPEGATLERTRVVTDRAVQYLEKNPYVAYVQNVTGSSPRVGSNQARSELTVILKPWEERKGISIDKIMENVEKDLKEYPECKVYLSTPPVIPGLGTSGGFEMQLEARGEATFDNLVQAADTLMYYAQKHKELTGLSSSLQSEIPQLYFDVDRDKVKMLGVPLADVFSTMKAYTGSVYVNDFNMFNRIYKVYIQAEAPYREHKDNINLFFVKAKDGVMVPLTSLGNASYTTGPGSIKRFNMFTTAVIRGSAAQGYSSGQAMEIMEQIARNHLPDNIGLEWSGLSYQEKKAGGQTGLVLTLVFLFVFLFLAAQYESWTVPIAVLLSLPVAALGAYLGVVICGLENDIYFQIGLVMLVGLAAKNAILIVEFAKVQVDKGGDLIQSAIHAAQLRFRPILMTSLAFVLGMLPMVLASGPGSASRQAIGTGVFFGMIFAIVFGIVLVPFFFVLVYKTKAKVQHKIKKD